jgi:hypothetical protein
VKTPEDRAVAAGPSVDPDRWLAEFEELMALVAGRFARVESRRRARAFVLGLLSGLRRKNCWTIAGHAGDATTDGMQHLLAGARWDAAAIRDDLRAMWWSTWVIPARCWWSMRPAICASPRGHQPGPSGNRNRPGRAGAGHHELKIIKHL